jgi:hypothetical protein
MHDNKDCSPFFILDCEAIGTAATPGLLCQPRVIVKMSVEKHMECRLAGETEVLGENLPQRHFSPSQNPTWPDRGLNPGLRGGKPATNRLSYGATSLTLTEEHRLRVFENRVLRRIFGPKRDKVTGGWRKLHNEELHNLYSLPSIVTTQKVWEPLI